MATGRAMRHYVLLWTSAQLNFFLSKIAEMYVKWEVTFSEQFLIFALDCATAYM